MVKHRKQKTQETIEPSQIPSSSQRNKEKFHSFVKRD